MAYRVLMEVVARPDDIEPWIWDGLNEERGVALNGHADFKHHSGGKAWTGKLAITDTLWEYAAKRDADTKMAALDAADSTNRRYKVVEV